MRRGGVFYFGARYYDADVGRWVSTDPAEQFWDLYSYAGNGYNPINATDPDGEKIKIEDGASRDYILKFYKAWETLREAGITTIDELDARKEVILVRPRYGKDAGGATLCGSYLYWNADLVLEGSVKNHSHIL